jgi:lipid A 3-O-deacylase
VARDLFLDGATFRPSLRRDHKPFVSDWERGFGLRVSRFGIEYRAVTQSREYRDGPASHTFGGISLAWWSSR